MKGRKTGIFSLNDYEKGDFYKDLFGSRLLKLEDYPGCNIKCTHTNTWKSSDALKAYL